MPSHFSIVQNAHVNLCNGLSYTVKEIELGEEGIFDNVEYSLEEDGPQAHRLIHHVCRHPCDYDLSL